MLLFRNNVEFGYAAYDESFFESYLLPQLTAWYFIGALSPWLQVLLRKFNCDYNWNILNLFLFLFVGESFEIRRNFDYYFWIGLFYLFVFFYDCLKVMFWIIFFADLVVGCVCSFVYCCKNCWCWISKKLKTKQKQNNRIKMLLLILFSFFLIWFFLCDFTIQIHFRQHLLWRPLLLQLLLIARCLIFSTRFNVAFVVVCQRCCFEENNLSHTTSDNQWNGIESRIAARKIVNNIYIFNSKFSFKNNQTLLFPSSISWYIQHHPLNKQNFNI